MIMVIFKFVTIVNHCHLYVNDFVLKHGGLAK